MRLKKTWRDLLKLPDGPPALAAWVRFGRMRLRRLWRDLFTPAGGPAGRTRRRVALLVSFATLVFAILAFPEEVGKKAGLVCKLPGGQPELADACGFLHVPGIPSRGERIAWSAARGPSCAGLRAYQKKYSKGVHAADAYRRLSAGTWQRATSWEPLVRDLSGALRSQAVPFATQEAALADAQSRIAADATALACSPVDGLEELRSVSVISAAPHCLMQSGGFTCAIDYRVRCNMRVHPMVEVCP